MNSPLPSRWTALPRDIDLKLPYHQAILGVSVAAAVGGWLVAWLALGLPWIDSLIRGGATGLAVFATWVIARELDPDQPRSAFVGLPLSSAIAVLAGAPDWLALAWAGLWLRAVNRSTGLPARPLDSLLLVGLGLAAGWRLGPLFVILTVLALGMDGFLRPSHRVHRILAVVMLLAGLMWIAFRGPTGSPIEGFPWAVVVIGIGLYLTWIAIQPSVESTGDYSERPLSMARVRAAQWLAGAVILTATISLGSSALRSFSSLLAAMAGVAAYGWGLWLLDRLPGHA